MAFCAVQTCDHVALVIDSRLAHGPWPGGGSGPAFMTAVSRLSLTGSDGLTLDIPGEVRTTVGLTGHGTARFLSPGLDRTLGVGEGRFNWDGADVTVGFDAGGETLDSAGRFGRLVLSNPDGELVLGDVELATRSRRSDFGFWTGTSDIRVDRMEAIAPDGSVFASAGSFVITRTGTGTYRLIVPGESPDSGMLLLSVAGLRTTSLTAPDDNLLVYETSGDDFLIRSRDFGMSRQPSPSSLLPRREAIPLVDRRPRINLASA